MQVFTASVQGRNKMKKRLIIVAVVIILIFTGIYISKNVESKKPAEQQITETDENKTEESANSLTENEIKAIYLKAHKLYVDWSSPAVKYLDADWEKTTIIDGVEYFEVIPNEISSVDELKKAYQEYFCEEIIKENIDRYYVMHNGKMYGNAVLIEGGGFPFESHEITVKTNTPEECTFTVKSSVGDSYDESEYTLKVIDGKWKFTGVFNWVSTDELVLD